MADYTYNHGAKFPKNGITTQTNYRDITNDDWQAHGNVIMEIQKNLAAGKINEAAALIIQNNLKDLFINANDVNRIDEEIRNTQINTRSKKQNIYYSTTAPLEVMEEGDIWIGGK